MSDSGKDLPAESVYDCLPEVVIVGNSSHRIESQNRKALSAFGPTVGQKCHEVLRGLEKACEDCLFAKEGDSREYLRFIAKNEKGESWEILEARLSPDPDHWIAVGRQTDVFPLGDVNYTELAVALDSMGDGVTIVDPDGTIIYANKSHERLHGYSQKELVGSPISIFFPPESKIDKSAEIFGATKKGGWQGIVTNVRKDGSRFPASLKTAPLHDRSGKVVGYLGIVRDVSEMEKAKEQLQGEIVGLEKHLEEEMAELTKRFDQLKFLQNLGRRMVTSSNEGEIASNAAAVLVESMGYMAAAVITISDSKEKRSFQIMGDHTKISPGKYGRKVNERAINRAIKEEASIIERYPEERLSVGVMARSELIAPLMQMGRAIGAIVVADPDESRFSADDVSIAETIADLVSVSLANCYSSRQIQDREQALNLLDDITLQTISRMDISEILGSTAEKINKILETQTCLIGVANPAGGIDWIAMRGAEEFRKELTDKRTFALLTKVMRGGSVYYTNDYLSDPDISLRGGTSLLINSLMISPIRLSEETIGAITLINKVSAGGFTDQNATLLQNLSDHLAVLMHNAEAMVSLDYSLRTRNSLLRTTFDLQAATGVPDIHQKVADMLLEVVPYDAARFYSVRGDGITAVLSRNLGGGANLTGMEDIVLDIVERTLAERKGWIGIHPFRKKDGEPSKEVSLLVIPLIGKEEEVGAIVIARTAEMAFSDQDREVATLFANHAAIALENAMLLAREKDMLDESNQRIRQLESILDLTTSVMAVERQEEAVKKVLSAMTTVLGFSKGLILSMSSEHEGELVCMNATGFTQREVDRLNAVRIPMSDLLSILDGPGKLVGERTFVLSDEVTADQVIDEELTLSAQRVLSNLRVESKGDKFVITIEDNRGDLVGVILLAEASGKASRAKGLIDLLEIYGNLASIAINNARMFEREIAARSEVETLNDLMTHDINNFIQGVLGYIDMIRSDADIGVKQKKYAERAVEQIESTKRLIENVRKLSWIKAGFPEKMETYDLGKVIGESLEAVRDSFPKKDLIFTSAIGTDEYFVSADEMIGELFINLFSNSVKFTPSSEVPLELFLKTQYEFGKDFWRVEVVDHGRGIPEDKKQFVFERLGRQDYTPYGFGLGLSIARNLARKYGGRIWVENRVPEDYRKGSKFIVLLPKIEIPAPPEEKAAAEPKKKVVRKVKQGAAKPTYSRVLKQPQQGRNAGGKASAGGT